MSHLPRQDVAPSGGFPSISYTRSIPRKGFGSLVVLGAVVGISAAGMAKYITAQKAENEKRFARIAERHEFLEKLDKHLYKRYLGRVEKQAELDVIAMDKLIAGEKFVSNRPPAPTPPTTSIIANTATDMKKIGNMLKFW